jgi:hypothetical protein
MVEGLLTSYSRGSGSGGVVYYATVVDRTVIGSGAAKRLTLGMTIPYYSDSLSVEKALFDMGLIVPKDVPLPFRIVVNIDGVTVTREFKPQALVPIEEGFYGKVIYDATALLSSKLTRTDLHRLSVVYTAARHVVFEDAGLAVVYRGVEGGWYSYNLLGGAIVVEPGEILAVDVDLPESRSEAKTLVVKMHVPSRFAEVRVEAAGARVEAGGVTGPTSVEVPLRFRGSKTRVYIYYEKPSQKFYPSKLVVSSIALYEAVVPLARLEIVGATWESPSKLHLVVENSGVADARDVRVLVISQGATLATGRLDLLRAGERAEFELEVKRETRRKSDNGEALLRVMWRTYGVPGLRDERISLSGAG